MAAHTVFIILIVAAFLAWAVSFSMRIMKERSRHLDRRSLDRQKEAVLDRIAALEVARESGAVPESRYSLEMKHLRGELARVLDHIRRAARPSPEKSRTAGDKRRA